MATISHQLGRFVAELRADQLPPEVVAHTKQCVLDSLGCGLHGSTTPWVRILRETLAAGSASDGAAPSGSELFGEGGGSAVDPWTAAMINGTAVHSFELDDLHPRSILHPGAVVVPTVLAAAALRDLPMSGREFLRAVVAGYEVGSRAGSALGAGHLLAGWHPTGTHGTLAAAAAASAALGLDANAAAQALGVAGSMSAGLMASQYGAMVKRLHAGNAAKSGLQAAALAGRGFTGIETLFESTYGGYLSTFTDPATTRPDTITSELGERWEVAQVGFKRYAACGSNHTSIDAIRELREREGIEADDVESVEIAASTATVQHVGWDYEPDSITTAQMNLPYAVAVTLVDGDAFVEQYTPERITDPRLVALARKVRVYTDPATDRDGDSARHRVTVTIHRRDGASVSVTRGHATGSAAHPLRPDDVTWKFHRLADGVLGSDQAARVRGMVERIDEVADIRELARHLTSAPSHTSAPTSMAQGGKPIDPPPED